MSTIPPGVPDAVEWAEKAAQEYANQGDAKTAEVISDLAQLLSDLNYECTGVYGQFEGAHAAVERLQQRVAELEALVERLKPLDAELAEVASLAAWSDTNGVDMFPAIKSAVQERDEAQAKRTADLEATALTANELVATNHRLGAEIEALREYFGTVAEGYFLTAYDAMREVNDAVG